MCVVSVIFFFKSHFIFSIPFLEFGTVELTRLTLLSNKRIMRFDFEIIITDFYSEIKVYHNNKVLSARPTSLCTSLCTSLSQDCRFQKYNLVWPTRVRTNFQKGTLMNCTYFRSIFRRMKINYTHREDLIGLKLLSDVSFNDLGKYVIRIHKVYTLCS